MALIDSTTFECEKCGNYCEIEDAKGDGVNGVAWCLECEDYAQGFDGSGHFYEQAVGEADNLRKKDKSNG